MVPAGENNKPKGHSAGSRSAFIVLVTAGNRVRWDPPEGRGASYEQDLGGETARELESRHAVHGTAGDSRTEREARICRTRSLVRQLRTLGSVGGEGRLRPLLPGRSASRLTTALHFAFPMHLGIAIARSSCCRLESPRTSLYQGT